MTMATTALVCTAALGALVFVVRYLFTNWFRSQMGRHAMAFMFVVLVVLALVVSKELVGEWFGRDLARLLSYTAINGVIWRQVYLLFKAQSHARGQAAVSQLHQDDEPKEATDGDQVPRG